MLYFEPTVCDSPSCTARFTAKDGGVDAGMCELLIENDCAKIVSLAPADVDPLIGEGLVRAALNFAANRGVYLSAFCAPGMDHVRARLPFRQQNGNFQNDIPTLLTGSCCGVDKMEK